ncbi:hypothetical protein QP446_03070 [Corynebacterium riegelii]|uniref:DUF6541 family protein n=1 Tax=Corynebacterium riegelii TaxID=156976 RepID=UPI00254B537F|nr:DUF6541 family protein [Corynebacterium riegelii]MDK7179747.1 hypothetical protein [Corynebacterium riegelii]
MTSTAAVWFAVVFFMLPGFVVNWVAGMRVPAAVAAALPVSFGMIGMSAWMWGLTTAPLNLWTFTVSWVLTLGVAAAWRYSFARRARRRGGDVSWRRALFPGDGRAGSVLDPAWVLPGIGVVAGAWMSITDRLGWLRRLPNGLDNIVQGWDVQWHANAVRFIMETGVASPTRMGELQNLETHAALLYPSGFHAGVALFAEAAGLEPIPALNISQIVLPGIALPMSMACLVLAFLRSRGLTAQIAAGLAAALVYGAPQILWVSDYVGMWPYLFAMTLTGTVVWLFLRVPFHHASALPAALGFLGVLCAHPSAVTVVVVCVALAWVASLVIKPARSRISDLLWLGAPALGASVVFLPQILAGTTQAEEVSGWRADEAFKDTDAWAAAFYMQTRHVDQFFPNFAQADAVSVLWLALIGAVVMVFWRGQVWPVLVYAISLCAAVNAIDQFDNGFGTALNVLGNLHYNTPHRLILPVVMCVVAAVAVALAAMVRLVTLAPLAARSQSTAARSAATAASVAVALVLGAVAVPAVRAETVAGAEDSFASPRSGGRMVSADDLAAFDWLATQPKAFEGYTMGDPADGHSWMYAYNGVPTMSRHYLWPTGGRGTAFDITYWNVDDIGEGLRGQPRATNIADKAVEALDVNFYMDSPASFWHFQRTNQEAKLGLWASHGVTPVYRKGKVVIFAVNAAFTPAEIKAMRADALNNGSDAVPLLAPAGGTSTASTTGF